MIYKNILRPLLFKLDPETAHNLTYTAGSLLSKSEGLAAFFREFSSVDHQALHQHVLGLHFSNPVGLAAGFDKNGHLPHAIYASGFGFTEIGSITAQSSLGNPKPRVFRLPADQALVNRMGLNNDGAETIITRLQSRPRAPFPIGINIAKTHNPRILGDRAIADYLSSFKTALPFADYIMINISCPNTEEGKTFEDPTALSELLSAVVSERGQHQRRVPILVKFSADLDRATLESLLTITESFGVDGYAAVNTSANRTNLSYTPPGIMANAGRGGLSGSPLRERSKRIVRWIYQFTNGGKPIVGIGGVFSAEDAIALIRAGANLVQVYTGLVYEGPAIPYYINQGILAYIHKHGLSGIDDIRGRSESE